MLLHLCPLTPDNIPAALTLDQRCFGGLWSADGYAREIDSPNSELWTLQPCRDNCEQQLPAHLAALAPNQPEPPDPSQTNSVQLLSGLGCYWAILEEAHITLLAIDPTYQRQGLGQALLYILLNSAHQRGLERATLEVRASNESAISLYEKFGFAVAGRRRRYYADSGEDAIVLWRGELQYPQFRVQLQRWAQTVQARLARSGWQLEPPLAADFTNPAGAPNLGPNPDPNEG